MTGLCSAPSGEAVKALGLPALKPGLPAGKLSDQSDTSATETSRE